MNCKADLSRLGAAWHFQRDVVSTFDPVCFLATARRHAAKFAVWIGVCVLAAFLIVTSTPPEYTAKTQVMLEPVKRHHILVDIDGATVPMDSAQADSQLQVIQSERMLKFVFDTLDLGKVPPPPASWKEKLMARLNLSSRPKSVSDDTQAFLDFADHVSARRIGLSYVLEISFRASNPRAAAEMVNSITAAYIRDLVLSTPSDSELLQKRISSTENDAQLLFKAIKTGTIPAARVVGIDARVIGAAIEPQSKSAPHTSLLLLLGLCVGLTTGAAALLFLHNRDCIIRSEKQLRKLIGSNLLAPVAIRMGRHPTVCDDDGGLKRLLALFTEQADLRSIGFISCSSDAATYTVAKKTAKLLSLRSPVAFVTKFDPSHDKEAFGSTIDLDSADAEKLQSSVTSCTIPIDFLSDHNSWISAPTERNKTLAMLRKRGGVVVSLPSLETSQSVVATAQRLDGIVLVVQQNATASFEIDDQANILTLSGANILGAIIVNSSRSRSAHAIKTFSRVQLEEKHAR